LNATELQESLAGFVAGEISCEAVDGRLACVLPFAYPDGDSVVVYVSQRESRFEVTDYGEAIRMAVGRPGVRLRPLAPTAGATATTYGVTYGDGRFSALATPEMLADVIWRVGQASSDLAHALTVQRPDVARDEPFVDEVESELKLRGVPVEREHRLEGASGHAYRATLYVPQTHTILEPLAADGAWNAASAVYVEFGDLGRSNGFSPVAIVDDRDKEPEDQLVQLLVQVGDIVRWTERVQWLPRVTNG
jgi:hypothetical protein